MEGPAQQSVGSLKLSAPKNFAQMHRAALPKFSSSRVAQIQWSQVERPHILVQLWTLWAIYVPGLPRGLTEVLWGLHTLTPASSVLCFYLDTICSSGTQPPSHLNTLASTLCPLLFFVKSRTKWNNAKHRELLWWVWDPIWTGYTKKVTIYYPLLWLSTSRPVVVLIASQVLFHINTIFVSKGFQINLSSSKLSKLSILTFHSFQTQVF